MSGIPSASRCEACGVRWKQPYRNGMCQRCYAESLAVRLAEQQACAALGNDIARPDAHRTVVVEGVEYEVMYDGT